LVGVDVGTSAVKVGAYALDGTLLAQARQPVAARRAAPGQWEVNVADSLNAFRSALAAVTRDAKVRDDPPSAVALSSSGREVFPAAENGSPLGPCLMTADTRGDDVASRTAARHPVHEWFRLTGHEPRRMDPVNRALWWQETYPAITESARWFLNWHEYYALLLSGRPVADASNAGAWAVYDIQSGDWSADLISETGINPSWLPEIQSSGTLIGQILPDAAKAFSLPEDTAIATGAWDMCAAAVGVGAVRPGTLALTCGSWHSFVLPISPGWGPDLVEEGVTVVPHPGPPGFGLAVFNPNGMSVVDWARGNLSLSTTELEAGLDASGPAPGPVFADCTFTPLPHAPARAGGGVLDGLTLATSAVDIVRALLESIACDFALTLERLQDRGYELQLVRASGGGASSPWLMQLHADLSGLPVEVVAQPEPGAFGAAILAGVACGVYESVSAAVERLVSRARRFEPNEDRGRLYAGVRNRLAASRGTRLIGTSR
jgi:xylulokinase